MGKDKSILEKFTDKVKDISKIATDAANHALEAEEPPLKADDRSAAYIPLAADGLVCDPMMVPAPAVVPPAKGRAVPKRVEKAGKRARAKKAARKSASKAAPTKRSAKPAKTSGKQGTKAANKARKRTRA